MRYEHGGRNELGGHGSSAARRGGSLLRRLRAPLSAAFLVVAASAAFAADGDCRVIVGFKGAVDKTVLSACGVTVESTTGNRAVGTVSAAGVVKLRAAPSVSYVEEDAIVQASGKPTGGGGSDPAQILPWGVQRVWGAGAAPSGAGGAGVNVAVLDTGIDKSHHDLTVKGGTSYVKASSTSDDNGHGTHVAGTICAMNNGIGVVGVAPNAVLFSVKVLDFRGSGTLSAVASGVDWARLNGMKVANMSLGSSSDSVTLSTACTNAANAGVLLVAAAGNDGPGKTSFPAAYPNVVAVGATDSSDVIAHFSNTGEYVDISAPGVEIYSCYKGNLYRVFSGTSMASPHVAGLAAAIWSDTAGATRAVVLAELLGHHARHVPAVTVYPDVAYGFGIAYCPYIE
jgi:subtilisin